MAGDALQPEFDLESKKDTLYFMETVGLPEPKPLSTSNVEDRYNTDAKRTAQFTVSVSTDEGPSSPATDTVKVDPGVDTDASGSIGLRLTDWIVRFMGYKREEILERDARPWLMMLATFPLPWLAGFCVMLHFVYGTRWNMMYVVTSSIMLMDYVLLRPFSLEVRWRSGKALQKLAKLFGLVRMGCIIYGSVAALPGLVYPSFRHLVPWGSPTLHMVGMMLMGPLILFVAHFHSHWVRLTKSTTTAVPTLMGIAFFTYSRYNDPIVDAALGLRVLLDATPDGNGCPYQGGSNCTVHHAIGLLMLIFAGLDFIANLCIMTGLDAAMLPRCRARLRSTIFEAFMLACEASSLVCVLILSLTGMVPDNKESRSYAALCALATAGAMAATLLSLLTPQTATALAEGGRYKSAVLETVQVYANFLGLHGIRRGKVVPAQGSISSESVEP